MLGGCSSLNYLFYVRGDARDFNYWQEDLGFDGWSFDDVLPYFLRAESYLEKRNLQYGRNGELPIRDSLHLSPLAKIFQNMSKNYGYTQVQTHEQMKQYLYHGLEIIFLYV